MSRRFHLRIERWLAAERRGDESAAERRLAGAFRAAGRPRPSTGFARRVMAGLRPAESFGRPVSRGLRPILIGALMLVAVAVAGVPLALDALGGGGDRVLGLAIGLLSTASERLAHGLTAWNVVARVSRTLAEGLADRTVLATLALVATLGLFAFGWLSQLVAVERRAENV